MTDGDLAAGPGVGAKAGKGRSVDRVAAILQGVAVEWEWM